MQTEYKELFAMTKKEVSDTDNGLLWGLSIAAE